MVAVRHPLLARVVGFPGNVVTMKAGGKGRKMLTDDGSVVGRAVYSPDGKRILASRWLESGGIDLFSVSVKGGTWKRLTKTGASTITMFNLQGAPTA